MAPSRWIDGAYPSVVALALLALVAYWNSLSGGFHFDDQAIFLDPHIVGSGFGWEIFRLTQTRPLTFLTFHWNYLVSGASPVGFHLVNVALHAANTALVFLIAKSRFPRPVALLAGALFAVHPLQTQAVNYVFERATLLAAFFALLCLLFFLRERYSLAIIFFGLSLLAKEETIALPAFLLLISIFDRRQRIRWRFFLAMSVVAVLFTARLFYALHAAPEAKLGFGKGIPVISYALTQSRVVWRYLRLFLVPSGLSLDHDLALSQALLSPPSTLAALATLCLLTGTLAYLAWRKHELALWGFGFLLLLSPSSSIVPVIDLMFEHRTYFPLACLTIAAAGLLLRMPVRVAIPIVPVLLAVLLGTTIVRNQAWTNDRTLWTDVVEKSPHKARGYFQLAQSYASEDVARARILYERGLAIEPGNPTGHTNLGLILMSQGDHDAALSHLRRALQSGGDKPLLWNNIGAVQLRREEPGEAVVAFRKAIELAPCRFDARVNLMRVLSHLEDHQGALVAGVVPENCRLLPEQIQKLETERLAAERLRSASEQSPK